MSASDENENLTPVKDKSAKEVIVIKVADPNGQVLSFKVKKIAPLSKLMSAYCDKQNITDRASIRFFFDGSRINENDSPLSLRMENEDVIEVYTQQTGGKTSSKRNDFEIFTEQKFFV